MSDYIKRDAIIKALGELCDTPAGQSTGLTALVYAVKTVEGIPAADVVERKSGKWREDMWITAKGYSCSECNGFVTKPSIFCPDCGADMREVNDGT